MGKEIKRCESVTGNFCVRYTTKDGRRHDGDLYRYTSENKAIEFAEYMIEQGAIDLELVPCYW